MRNKRLIKLLIISSVLFLIFSFFSQKEKIIINESDLIDIEQFDIILSSGQSVQSKLSNLFNVSINSYSHIGIIQKENNEIYILHSTPDGTNDNGIRYDTFQDFINLSNVNYYRILRLDSLVRKEELEKSISYFRNNKFPFDYEFDNETKEKIYCSELIFDILSKSDLIKSYLDLSKPIHPKKFIEMTEFKTIKERKSTANK